MNRHVCYIECRTLYRFIYNKTILIHLRAVNIYKLTVINSEMQTFFVNGNVIIASYMGKNNLIIINYLELIDQKIHTPKINLARPFNQYLYNCFNVIFKTLIRFMRFL